MTTGVIIVVALPCEARPLRRHLGLRAVATAHAYPTYRAGPIALIISGVGVAAAAAAVEAAAESERAGPRTRWLNVGIAGHPSLSVGTALLGSSVVDERSGKCWPLSHAADWPYVTAAIRTVQRPEEDYPEDYAYEMEAAGFVDAVRRFESDAFVQCLKVVSDNPQSPPRRVNARRVAALIDGRVDAIDALLRSLAGSVRNS
jgi:adenosylhomocysteine nucleosidase